MATIKDAWRKFVTGVGLVTSNGPAGYNIMACEWTFNISYEPFLIACAINFRDATNANIKKTKVFGASIAGDKQATLASASGGATGWEYNKIAALKELGFKFSKAKKIDVLMPKDTALSAECKVIKIIRLGDHDLFVGKVVNWSVNEKINPYAKHQGRYWYIGKNLPKPSDKRRAEIEAIIEKHKK